MLIAEPPTGCLCCLDSLTPRSQQSVLSLLTVDACPGFDAAVNVKMHCHVPRSAQTWVTCAQYNAVWPLTAASNIGQASILCKNSKFCSALHDIDPLLQHSHGILVLLHLCFLTDYTAATKDA